MISVDSPRLPLALSRVSAAPVFALLSLITLFACGCSRNDGNSTPAASSQAFDTAPAELKEKWQMAAASGGKSDYLGAVTNLAVLLSKSEGLSADQQTALQQAWSDIGNRAFQAANNGDKAALEAVMTIRAVDAARNKGVR